ncbi:MAG: FKBP-type peptidyl-prolyl cis-trans isomerase [Bacteroidetes bacterium]|nr:FKBP-type peptidyl-prolyl cis-trans isomerase [Bacteroidota bacterium]
MNKLILNYIVNCHYNVSQFVKNIAFFSLFIYLFISCKKNETKVKCGDTVTLAYKITNLEGMRLDESFLHPNFNRIDKKELFRFTTCHQEIIPGWDSVIIGCKTRKIYTFEIPAELAYDKTTIYHDIPPNSKLILKFKIFKIE